MMIVKNIVTNINFYFCERITLKSIAYEEEKLSLCNCMAIITYVDVILSFQPAFAQGKYKLMRLHEPTDSVEQPVKLTKKKVDTRLTAPKAEAVYPGDEYLMRTYSVFDPQTGDNIFIEGGKLTTYPVYIQLDDNSGEAKITNLINMSSPSTITGIWDKDANTITVNTPSYWTDPYKECAIIGKDGDYDLFSSSR